ncbi:hypothetical protein HPC62_17635 [Thermoleptolyngbya sichuanensis A183]|uniref:Uncharacterized protein n=1 Tax=Thermoleptolyngbya sichuanensis A183 TaxID=2737172 RepID=A0A6M8BLC3_9CYAN|nr:MULTISPECIES: hypothetical protein [Thermoleptolyngbya]QKD83773.1 hypothetical protein HPC62_17635 [Thermoleptolyngbya sichuanensis A183]
MAAATANIAEVLTPGAGQLTRAIASSTNVHQAAIRFLSVQLAFPPKFWSFSHLRYWQVRPTPTNA